MRKSGGLTRTEIQGKLGRSKNATQIDLAISLLLLQNLIEVKTLKTGGRGRPTEHYLAK